MMLGYRFLKINGESIPNPVDGFSYSFDEDETVKLSEAGTELVRVRRLDKRTFTGTWNLTSFWLNKFAGWSCATSVSLTYQGHTYTVRMRDFKPKLAKNSEFTETSEGLWTVSPSFTEI